MKRLLTISTVVAIACISTASFSQSIPTCQTDSDPDGDGFGWENGQSCRASTSNTTTNTTNSGAIASSVTVVCQADSDPDGDGFGFENGQSCIVQTGGSTNNSTTNNTPTGNNNSSSEDITVSSMLSQCLTDLAAYEGGTTCIDTAPVGDGWGWDGSTSCRVNSTSTSQANACSSNTTTNFSNTTPTCSDASDRIMGNLTVGMTEADVLRAVGKSRHTRTVGNTLYLGYNVLSGNDPEVLLNATTRTVVGVDVNTNL